MSKIYGFGNALIDIEISISEEQLSSLGIIKGSMIHISRNQKIKWLLDFKDNILILYTMAARLKARNIQSMFPQNHFL